MSLMKKKKKVLNLQKERKNDSKQKDTEKDSEIAGLYKKRKAGPKAKGNVSRR